MTSRLLRMIDLPYRDPLKMGHVHGEAFRQEIVELAEIRMERMCKTSQFTRSRDVLALAERHLPILQGFDVDLFLEFKGISEASNLALERLVILNHLTDMRDIIKTDAGLGEGGCSIIFTKGQDGPILGQTWDMHGSAEPYVILMRLHDSLLFSVTGCLGMTGLNRHGVGIAINNLASIDAGIGVIWPALVRKALTHETASEAREEVMNAKLGSGRHFAIADEDHFFGIETSGTRKKIIWDRADQTYIHTNHCLDDEMRKTHVIRHGSTTIWRYQHLNEMMEHRDLSSAEKVFLALAEVSFPVNPGDIHEPATCGTFVMDIKKRFALSCHGIASEEVLQWSKSKVFVT